MKLSSRNTLKKHRRKANKTIKKKIDHNKYYKSLHYINKMSNSNLIKMLEDMENLFYVEGEPFKARAYSKAKETVMLETDEITSSKSLVGKNGFRKGGSVIKSVKEFLDTGKVEKIEASKNDPKHLFTSVYGIGPKIAKKLADPNGLNIKSIAELRERKDELLNDVQRKGLRYYDDILERIPRKEIDKYAIMLKKYFSTIKSKTGSFQIVGSWRRGAKNSGDIDIIITDSNDNNSVYKKFIDKLIEKKILIEVLSRGNVKTLGISRLSRRSTARRIDFMFTPKKEFTFAMLYFTGSKIFNTIMRKRALDMGYTMNEHGIYNMVNKKKGERLEQYFPTERSVFEFLGIEYREPHERKDGNSFKLIEGAGEEVTKEVAKKVTKKVTKKVAKKVTEKKALKKKPQTSDSKKNLKTFQEKGESFLKTLNEKDIENMIKVADDQYYGKNKPLLQDETYDVLRDWAEEKYPKNEIIQKGHEGIQVSDDKKVQLPFYMPSMDKIKPDTKVLGNWMKKYKGGYVISAKLDGMSALYCKEGDTLKLYSRGNGQVGHDISYLLPYLKLPKIDKMVVRGELIITKTKFKKYKKDYANERSFASGQQHSKNLKDKDKLRDLDFVAYEIIKPEMKPSMQYKMLSKNKFKTVINKSFKKINQDILSKYLMDWREKYDYIIDGVICINDKQYSRKTKGNPDHAFAFKKVMNDQVAESIVIDVLWSKTKYGYVKPKIKMRPVKIGGVKITYATAHNAKYIVDNNIGVGSVIQVVRSGDVIPKVLKVIKPSKEPKMPDEDMGVKWNKSRVDLILKDMNDSTVRDKTTLAFFKTISVDGLKEGNLKKIINAGHETIGSILEMEVEDFLEIPGFKEKMANKIHSSMKKQIGKVELSLLMDASNTFGRGMGESRFKLILAEYPDIIESKLSSGEKREMVSDIDGFAEKTAMKFVKNIREFKKFLKTNKLEYKLKEKPKKKKVNKSHPLYDKKILMSGFRDDSIAMKIRDIGGQISSSVSKHLNFLVVKDKNTKGSKLKKAQEFDNIKIITKDDFVNKYL